MLRNKFFVDALELFFNPFDLLPRRCTLLMSQLHCFRTGKPPLGAVHNRGDHIQIADQFGASPWRDLLLPLRFEKQRGVIQNACTDRRRALSPGGIQLAGFARIAVMLGEDCGHPLAIFQALARHRHQKLQSHLRQNLAFTHLLLDRFRQNLYQRQPPRYPTHTTIEAAG